MGNTISFLEAEKKTWIEHNILFDESSRVANLRLLDEFKTGEKVTLAMIRSVYGGVEFEHWFLTNEHFYFEFGSPSADHYSARVTISPSPRQYTIKNQADMSEEIRDRMRHVLGMSNYSLCLRNCEHVANYAFRGRWVSAQMDMDGILMRYFRTHILADNLRKVNTFPSDIRPHVFRPDAEKLYSFIQNHYTATQFNYYLDYNENTYNILVIGPTGSGKSHLINVFFNQNICDEAVSHTSVTREICFIRGRGKIYDFKEKDYKMRDVMVADTVGLCDTDWDDAQVLQLIKGRISSNFKEIDAVFIVLKTDRLLKEQVASIKKIMQWLRYDDGYNYYKFMFVITHAEGLDEATKDKLRGQVTEILDLKDTGRSLLKEPHRAYDSVAYTGFPSEDLLNEKGKMGVQESWELLQLLLMNPVKGTGRLQHHYNGARIRLPSVSSICNIL